MKDGSEHALLGRPGNCFEQSVGHAASAAYLWNKNERPPVSLSAKRRGVIVAAAAHSGAPQPGHFHGQWWPSATW